MWRTLGVVMHARSASGMIERTERQAMSIGGGNRKPIGPVADRQLAEWRSKIAAVARRTAIAAASDPIQVVRRSKCNRQLLAELAVHPRLSGAAPSFPIEVVHEVEDAAR